jgi:hypothetical protein
LPLSHESEENKLNLLLALKNFLVEEVTRSSGGKVSAKLVCYRGVGL